MDQFPAHVVCAWTGNSERVATKHYGQVTDEHYAQAASSVAQKATHHSVTTAAKGRQPETKQAAFPEWHLKFPNIMRPFVFCSFLVVRV